jgi:hypothetical protein
MYIVPNVPLIPQTQNMACWYASAQMVIQWRREKTQSSEMGIVDPSEDPPSVVLFRANNGLKDSQIVPLAKALGLELIPPVCPTPEILKSWLSSYGPLWTNGSVHITVITGIDLSAGRLFIHNPAPVGIGRREWKGLDWLSGNEGSSLDPNTNAGVFMHCPD